MNTKEAFSKKNARQKISGRTNAKEAFSKKKAKAENRQPDERPNKHFQEKSQGGKWEAK